MENQIILKKATHEKRISAFLIDIILSIVLILIPFGIGYVHTSLNISDSFKDIWSEMFQNLVANIMVFTGVILSILYFLLKDSFKNGQSIGKRRVNLKVIRLDNGKPCTQLKSIFRNIYLFLYPVLLIDFILVLLHKENRRIGDIVFETIVIDIEKNDIKQLNYKVE